ncbi:MAG TPA: rhomboid family intramembrane serine protease [Candidatus Binataceae bacterium]|nr:rhomboid family intramembrane serine protease [Candidatus Binataceae bacterium]
MIPLRDSEASRRLSAANSLLILLNFAVFALEMRLGPNAESTLAPFAMVPAQISHLGAAAAAARLQALATLATSLFLHGGLLHIAGNMLYLFIFGPAVEEAMGHLRYVCFYLLAGVAASLAMVAMGPESVVPVIGASGAIAGVLGAYFVLYPRGRILTILPVFVFIQFVEIPAVFYLLIWFAVQLYAGITSGAQGPLVGGVAWWAHVGGFLFGIAAAPIFTPQRVTARPRRR